MNAVVGCDSVEEVANGGGELMPDAEAVRSIAQIAARCMTLCELKPRLPRLIGTLPVCPAEARCAAREDQFVLKYFLLGPSQHIGRAE